MSSKKPIGVVRHTYHQQPEYWYIVNPDSNPFDDDDETYLWKDLTWHPVTRLLSTPSSTPLSEWPGYYNSEEEANQTLSNYMEGLEIEDGSESS